MLVDSLCLILSFVFLLSIRGPPSSTLFPYTTLFRSEGVVAGLLVAAGVEGDRPGDPLRVVDHLCRALEGEPAGPVNLRSEEHTSELQSLRHLVCRLLLEKKKKYETA